MITLRVHVALPIALTPRRSSLSYASEALPSSLGVIALAKAVHQPIGELWVSHSLSSDANAPLAIILRVALLQARVAERHRRALFNTSGYSYSTRIALKPTDHLHVRIF